MGLRCARAWVAIAGCAAMAGCAPHTPHVEHTLPPTVCEVPCPPPDVSPYWGAVSASWVDACTAMHEECREWVLTHYGGSAS